MTVPLSAQARRILHHLVQRDLVPDGAEVSVTPLTGGVSNDVFAVSGPGVDLVVKEALPVLRVESEWRADIGRIAIEARALRLAHTLTPRAVPAVVDFGDGVLAIERAPRSWTNWRDDLLSGVVDPDIARELGSVLGAWQSRTAGDQGLMADFGDRTVFGQLRSEPFHGRVALRHPDLAPAVEATVAVMFAARDCLVHGDFSPKNMLVSERRVWVLDWEVAHVGDATFDPAFLLTHLLLKSVHDPASAGAHAELASLFLKALTARTAGTVVHDPGQLVRQVGCLLLARVDGKSPAGYLTADERPRVRELGRSLLIRPVPDHVNGVLNAWEILT
ncbi:aminoglycoside phosphotransferase family protein [Actinomadura napierensis]|uniref:Aminoglycoside phosphotransferase family protein n=1 Tax=Actinomadura napierensis TaxID=267854 RepID=A0ABN2XVQ1_9ACTN